MIKCIKQKGERAYDGFVDALLSSETHKALGERLKNERNVDNGKNKYCLIIVIIGL